jgi:hypothetical protein
LEDLDEILCGGDAIVGDLEEITFNPIASAIVKWLSFKFMMWMLYLPHSTVGWDCFSIVGFPWLHHIKSLADVTVETR